ncbi:BTAD domain-containing putative transcriptional regulator [Nonomuraea sp. NPDC046802]|uniref:AfsR/SARP family transcriptional regulator n=1 Tax=Nonomuraea sp. NPDC046802 TaxID=3154919 RepID=UPI0033D0750E
MEYRLLGPVDLWRDGRSIPIVGLKQRTLLAVLVLKANQVVSHDRLLTALWGTEIPASSRKLLHNHLWSLRRLLSAPYHLTGTPAGYRLHVPPNGSDLAVFTAGTRAARTSLNAGDFLRAADQLREALALWRGAALTGTRDDLVLTDGAALDELRIAGLVDRIEADLSLGRHVDLISELRHLVTEYPTHEQLRGQLMTALHRSGRTAEALEEYQIGRRHLRRELALEPGQELNALHQAILSAAAPATGTFPTGTTTPVSARRSPAPHQLPADIGTFTGRDEHLRELDRLLLGESTAPTVAVITGAPGIGKTTLATHWSHQAKSRFPDGQLYIDLHGYSPGEPVTFMQALHQLLYGLGVAQDAIPHGRGERETLYQSLLADRRMLIVLDNAARADQVRPLLPSSLHCRVVITSRDALRGLIVTHDVRPVPLDVMSADEALRLLTAMLGRERVTSEIQAAQTLTRLCDHLPLALRLAAARLVSEPRLPLGEFVAGLAERNRLDALTIPSDPRLGVRDIFAMSYQGLTEPQQRAFQLMGLHPGPTIGLDEIVVMTGESRGDVGSAIDGLISAHLVHRTADGRYALHDLMWLFARELSHDRDSEPFEHASLSRLLDWLLHATNAAMDQIYRVSAHIELEGEKPVHELPSFDGFATAAEWLDLRYPTLMSTIRYARHHGCNAYVWRIVEILDYFFYLRNRIEDWLAALQLALEAARELGDQDGEGRILNALGMATLQAGRPRECIAYQQQALDLSRMTGDLASEAYALNRIGYSRLSVGEFQQAMADSQRAISLYRQLHNDQGESAATTTLGIACMRMGLLTDALASLRKCLDFERANGNRGDEGYTLVLMGDVYDRLGDLVMALDHYRQAVEVNRGFGQRRFEAEALNGIARVYRKQGRLNESLERHLRALALIRDEGDPTTECEILLDLGHFHFAAGNPDEALSNHRLALDMATTINDPFLQGLAHVAVADAHHALGQQAEAETHLRDALRILAPMGAPQAQDIADRLRGTRPA